MDTKSRKSPEMNFYPICLAAKNFCRLLLSFLLINIRHNIYYAKHEDRNGALVKNLVKKLIFSFPNVNKLS